MGEAITINTLIPPSSGGVGKFDGRRDAPLIPEWKREKAIYGPVAMGRSPACITSQGKRANRLSFNPKRRRNTPWRFWAIPWAAIQLSLRVPLNNLS